MTLYHLTLLNLFVLSKEMGSQDNGKWGEVMQRMANLDQGVRETLLGEVTYELI